MNRIIVGPAKDFKGLGRFLCVTHFLFFFAGQDIKSDGFSIETCKIMVDLLDVSFSVCCTFSV